MSFLTALVTSKVAASALAAGTLVVGGTAGAAYTGSLPTSLQETAHGLFGAPAPAASVAAEGLEAAAAGAAAGQDAAETAREAADSMKPELPDAAGGSAAEGPDATGPAAFGLCKAFAYGGLDTTSVAFASLAAAAKGESNIADYCATVPSPGEAANHRPDAAGAGRANIPAAPQLPAQAVIPAAPELPAQAVVPAVPQLPAQAVVPVAPEVPAQAVVQPVPELPAQEPAPVAVPVAPQEAPADTPAKPAPAGRP